MQGAPPIPSPPLLPPPLFTNDGSEVEKSVEVLGLLEGSSKSASHAPSSSSDLREAFTAHHEVMVQWMATVEKKLRSLEEVTEKAVIKMAEAFTTTTPRRRSRTKLTTGSGNSMIDEMEQKICNSNSTHSADFETSRTLNEARDAAKEAFRQDISSQIRGPVRVSVHRATERKGSTSDTGATTNVQLAIPELPGSNPVFDAHSGDKRTQSLASFERQFSPVLPPPVGSCSSLPDRSRSTETPCSSANRRQEGRVPSRPAPLKESGPPTSAGAPSPGARGTNMSHAVSHKSSQSLPSSQENEDWSQQSRSRRQSVEKLEVKRIMSTGNLTEVFKQRERALTAQLSPHDEEVQLSKVLDSAWSKTHDEGGSLDWSASRWLQLRPLYWFVSRILSKSLGLVPLLAVSKDRQAGRSDADRDSDMEAAPACCSWQRIFHWAGVAYRFLIVILILVFAAATYVRVGHCDVQVGGFCVVQMDWPGLSSDAAIALGALAMLLCWGGWSYKERTHVIAQSMRDLEDALEKKSLDQAFEVWSCSDSLMAVLFWGLVLTGRWLLLVQKVLNADNDDPRRHFVFLQELLYLISSGVIVLTSFWQVRASHAMTLIVHAWVEPFLSNEVSCDHLRSEWRTVSGLFRKTSRTFQHCCATMGFTSILLILSVLYDFRQGNALSSLPNALLGLCLPGVLLIHASTTTACKRLPSLVMLWEPNEDSNERDYMDLALFVSMSECGFFIWDTCVTLGLVQKFIYFTVAMASTLGFQSGVLKLSDLS